MPAVAADDNQVTAAAGRAELPALGAIARRALPNLVEATIVPAALFCVVLVQVGTGAAMVATLAWSAGALARRLIVGERVPSILVLSLLGLVLRTAVGLGSGTAALYFVQPLISAAVMGLVFLGSLALGRPLVASLASDFCPLPADVATRPGVVALFRRLTLLWAAIHLATAATTLALLVNLPLATFVAVKTAACMAITGAGVGLTVSWSLRTVRREGLVLAGRDGSQAGGVAHALALSASPA
ncbi:MAG: hypothetical protein M3Q48_14285 [Actinomycetota bacterium]|nr:hypothetical protein [Actinomycetota bacterium]